MAEEKQPHEKLADGDLNVKAAQEVHLQEDFKKADKAADQPSEKKKEQPEDK